MVHPDSIDKIIDIAVDIGITDIYAQVVIGGYAYCNIKNIPRSQYLSKVSGTTFDPLKALIKAAQKKKIKVHAWINTMLAWSLRQPPDSSRHIYFIHPEWFIKDIKNNSMRNYTYDKWVECGLEGLYLDPGQEKVRDFIALISKEIANKYAVAGIHLDFIRYPGTLWGLTINDTTALLSGFEGNDLIGMTFIRYPQLSFLQRWLVWHYWKAGKDKHEFITATVTAIQAAIRDNPQKTGIVLSAAIFPNPALSHYRFGQYWETWTNIISYPIAMAYTTSTPFYCRLIDYCKKKFPGTVMGIGLIWPEMVIEGNNQYFITRDAGLGTCLFDFTALDTLTEKDRLFNRQLITEPLDTIKNARLISNVFTDRPPKKLIGTSKNSDHQNEAEDFMLFLNSLSIDFEQDLKKLGIDQPTCLDHLSEDIIAFYSLDALVFPPANGIDTPPKRFADYAFFPWDHDDSLQTINHALDNKCFDNADWFYPEALNELSRSVFEAKIDTIDTCMTRAGIYSFKVTKSVSENKKVPRDSIPIELISTYLNWHLIKTTKQIIQQ